MTLKEIKSRKFGNGFVSLLNTEDGRPVEVTATCLPVETELRGTDNKNLSNKVPSEMANKFDYWSDKFMIGVSTQSGCPVKCKFCAVNKVTEKHGWRNLTFEEIIDQVWYAIGKVKSDYGYDLWKSNPKIFRILFTRMGEPSLNIDNVIRSVYGLYGTFRASNPRFQISTIGIDKNVHELVTKLINLEYNAGKPLVEYQFSVHSTDNDFRKWLQCEKVVKNEEINSLSNLIMKSMKRDWKVTTNFTLAEKTPFDIEKLKEQFCSDNVFVKLSPINENVTSDENGLKSRFEYKNSI